MPLTIICFLYILLAAAWNTKMPLITKNSPCFINPRGTRWFCLGQRLRGIPNIKRVLKGKRKYNFWVYKDILHVSNFDYIWIWRVGYIWYFIKYILFTTSTDFEVFETFEWTITNVCFIHIKSSTPRQCNYAK